MKPSFSLPILAIGIAATALGASYGCSSDDATGTGGEGRVPPKPTGAPTTAAEEMTFAVDSLSLGEATRAGATSSEAWKEFGYNLDGLRTTKTSSDVCTRTAGAAAANQEDGTEGVDNAFGKVIIPILKPFTATPSRTVTDEIRNDGAFTILFKIKGLTDSPTQTNTGLSGTILVGGAYGGTPEFTSATDWPYVADPQVQMSGAYVTDGTFVNGSGGATIALSLSISGVALDLVINKALITFKHSAPNQLTEGTIAGVLSSDQLIGAIERLASRISDQLCGGSTLDSIKQTLRQASDILQDGTNRAGVTCDGISIGIGFTAKRVANPTKIAGPPPPAPDFCSPDGGAGTDSGTDSGSDSGSDGG